jgi:molecular chaperone GrpE (heat shock protein)
MPFPPPPFVRRQVGQPQNPRSIFLAAREADRQTAENKRELIRSFLEVLDDLDRALDAAHAKEDAAELIEGIELVRDNFSPSFALMA